MDKRNSVWLNWDKNREGMLEKSGLKACLLNTTSKSVVSDTPLEGVFWHPDFSYSTSQSFNVQTFPLFHFLFLLVCNSNANHFKQIREEKPATGALKMAAAEGACLNHVSRESTDIKRLAKFYQEIFGFIYLSVVESPKFEFDVIWLKLPSFFLHLIERDPKTNLPEGPWTSTSAVADPKNLRRGHHICFSVANFDSFVQTLKDKGIETHQRSLPNAKTRQVFFFDPDGNGLEVASMEN